MKKETVSQALFRRLLQEDAWVPSAEAENWHVLNATGSTTTRKLRALHEAGYISVKYDDRTGLASYKAHLKKSEVVPEATVRLLKASEKPAEPKMVQTVRYEMRDGMRVAVVGRIPVYA